MAGTKKIGGRIVLEGESEYRNALKNIKTAQTELRSEMKLCTSEFKTSQNSLDALKAKYEIIEKQIEQQAKKVDVYTNALDSAKKAQEQYADRIEEYKKKLAEAEENLGKMADSSDTTSEAMDEQVKIIEKLKTQLSNAESGYDKTTKKVSDYQTQLNNAEADMINMNRDLETCGKYMKEAEQSTDKTAKSIDEYGKEIEDAGDKTVTFGDIVKANLTSELIVSGIKEICGAIKDMATAAVEVGSEFESSMSQVAATMGITASEIAEGSKSYQTLEKAAKDCGASTKYSASQAGEALNYLALAGYDANKAAATLPKVLDLAAAGGMDLAKASDLVTDSMAAMGLETKDLDKYIDEMAKTSQKSNTSVEQLGEATLVVAGTATLTGQSLETMNTELGILANNGIKSAEGGTHLRNVLLSLAAPTDNAAVALKELGVKTEDTATGGMRDLNDIMVDMNEAMKDMGDVEKTNIINKIFNKTDIAAVNALLKGTGEEFDDLKTEIENSKGAAQDMADTMNDNLKGQVTILQSALEGLGITAYDVFDEEMKTSVAGATNAVNRLNKEMTNGSLRVSMDKLSKSLAHVVDGAVELGEKALPGMIEGLAFALDNTDLLVSSLVGLGTAMAIGPIIEVVSASWTAYKTATEGATIAQWAMNAAMEANPAGILLTAVTALTAGMISYCAINANVSKEISETAQQSKNVADSVKTFNDTVKDSQEQRKKSSESLDAEAKAAKGLVGELEKLHSSSNLNTIDQAKLKNVVQQLNQEYPGLNLAIEDQCGSLNKTTEEINNYINASLEAAKLDAAREDLANIAAEQYEAEKQLYELEKQMAEQQAEIDATVQATSEYYAQCQEEVEKYGMVCSDATVRLRESQEAQEDANAAMDSLKEQYQQTEESIKNLGEEYQRTTEFIEGASDTCETGAEDIDKLGASADTTKDKFADLSQDSIDAMNKMHEELTETISDQIDMFDKFDASVKISSEQLISNMESQVEGITEWSENLASLADKGINKGLLQHLANMGPEGAGYVKAFVDMTDEQLQEANKNFEKLAVIPDATAQAISEAWAGVATSSVDGYLKEIDNRYSDIQKSGKEGIADTLVSSMQEGLGTDGDQDKLTETVAQCVEGMSDEIANGESGMLMQETLTQMCTDIEDTTKKGMAEDKYVKIAKQITAGLVKGIKNGKSEVVNAIVDMCEAAVEAAKSTLDIHSPSKRFQWLGDMSGKGFTKGLEESMANVAAIIDASVPVPAQGGSNISYASDSGIDTMTGMISRLQEALSNRKEETTVNVSLEGDAAELFRVVREEGDIFQKSTGEKVW